ncbi:MAG: hypothetical protein WCJ47_08530 [Methanomicrobiales archaeon]
MKNGVMFQKAYRDRNFPEILKLATEECRNTIAHLDPAHLALPPDLPHRYRAGIAEELPDKRAKAINHIHGNKGLAEQCARLGL